jgi:riboflavin kinase / FMN adenylyltransferase
MQLFTDLGELERGRPAILTIGAFDGVHRGHQYLIRQVVDRARRLEYESVVITFDPRPQVVLRPGSTQLSGPGEKARIIAALGPDRLVILPFTAETAKITAGNFLVSMLEHVNLSEVWVGADFAFGHRREGNVDFLIRSGQRSGFGVHIVARQSLGNREISSTIIRDLVGNGDVAAAAVLLGHYPRVTGTVVTGAGRGADMGFPTANVRPPETQFLPGTGIYAGRLLVGERSLPAAISVGYNVQFNGQQISVEAYALDFDGDLRGCEVSLDFIERIRDEARFESVDALLAQMRRDVDQVREVLAGAEEPGELLLPR